MNLQWQIYIVNSIYVEERSTVFLTKLKLKTCFGSATSFQLWTTHTWSFIPNSETWSLFWLSSKSGKISVLESEPGFSNAVASYVCVQSGQQWKGCQVHMFL